MMHTRRARFCRLVHHGICHQRSTVRGFLALARLAPNADVATLMRSFAAEAQVSIDALLEQRRLHCPHTLPIVVP
ncbi:MAG: hypothetical protein KGZ50_06450 [Peptococcaceae bacterium]|nr:hypothetical protein [Peptococcaceae bacterium]